MPFAPDARGDSFKELILTFYSPKRILQSIRSFTYFTFHVLNEGIT